MNQEFNWGSFLTGVATGGALVGGAAFLFTSLSNPKVSRGNNPGATIEKIVKPGFKEIFFRESSYSPEDVLNNMREINSSAKKLLQHINAQTIMIKQIAENIKGCNLFPTLSIHEKADKVFEAHGIAAEGDVFEELETYVLELKNGIEALHTSIEDITI